jgi:hypothetical protein
MPSPTQTGVTLTTGANEEKPENPTRRKRVATQAKKELMGSTLRFGSCGKARFMTQRQRENVGTLAGGIVF